MPPVNSAEYLQALKEKVAVVRSKAGFFLNETPPDLLQEPPLPGKWSALQCLEHLNSYGRFYLPALEKAIRQAEQRGKAAKPMFKSSWLGAWFTKLMEPKEDGTVPSKMKSPKDHVPHVRLDAVKVITEFIAQQNEMEALLTRAEKINIQEVKVATSLSKYLKLSVGDTFGFLVAHIRRHVLQAENAIRAQVSSYESAGR
ncbi:DinB superfamily protein [Chitinophaga terrae (ex Kim and Jung 2007)]|jgi:hypothetical protein|uniref:DinB superfamily protein n=1 Tax=Chitinophaga terrae (ex Kim and Jung 2007) TaxID=408074 RepID=A0A1H4F9T2_9BACT|nr:DinB family protein [Chitinophaga terrae (ex Kim and Jung 2007)]MDQ0105063.1 hypothetical protein [Chitinophaga terrae (ex Kim and Jung 2007)]GEP92285.1 hypothetical protein CTE07_39300 [Chitinophaga terrae (ex Kim and Jung 2007)]SEA94054.1 DinB superfamily protein [Chitinophaga terrae (ex Kim and Jung 2007)]